MYDLATGLRRRGWRVVLVHGPGRGAEPERFRAAFDAVSPMGQEARLLRGVEVIYTHKEGALEWLRAVGRGRRVCIAVHDHDMTCVRSHRYLPLTHEPCGVRPGLACVANGCVLVRDRGSKVGVGLRNPLRLLRNTRQMAGQAVLVAGSAYLRMTLVQAGVPAVRTMVIHPVPPDDTRPVTRPPVEPVVAFVGQLIRGKGLDVLIRAVARQPGVQLLVAGDGSGRAEAEALARKLDVQRRVEFLGALRPEEVSAVYDQARLLVVPSRWPEPFGMVGVEAMRRGRPVVGAWHGGIPEWLDDGETGMGFRPGDVEDLEHAMQTVLYGAEYEAMAERALASARTRFSYEAMLDRVEQVLGIGRAYPRAASTGDDRSPESGSSEPCRNVLNPG